MILFSNNNRLLENQKINLLVTINKFYSKIQSIEKKYLSEL